MQSPIIGGRREAERTVCQAAEKLRDRAVAAILRHHELGGFDVAAAGQSYGAVKSPLHISATGSEARRPRLPQPSLELNKVVNTKKKLKDLRRSERDKNFVAVTQKVFAILEALSQQPKSGVPLEEITQLTGIAKTTVHRLLYSMSKLGFIEQDPVTNLYSLSARFFELGTNALPYQRLSGVARPFMQTLMLTFGESVNLAVPHGGVAMYILVLESPKAHRVAATVGDYSYLHCTSVGKSIAAHMPPEERMDCLTRHGLPTVTRTTITTPSRLEQELEKVREEGVAVDYEENHEGIICIGGPIFASQGKVIAALSISGLTIHMAQKLEACKVAVRETVQKISSLLGYAEVSGPPSREGAQPSPAETPSSELAPR